MLVPSCPADYYLPEFIILWPMMTTTMMLIATTVMTVSTTAALPPAAIPGHTKGKEEKCVGEKDRRTDEAKTSYAPT